MVALHHKHKVTAVTLPGLYTSPISGLKREILEPESQVWIKRLQMVALPTHDGRSKTAVTNVMNGWRKERGATKAAASTAAGHIWTPFPALQPRKSGWRAVLQQSSPSPYHRCQHQQPPASSSWNTPAVTHNETHGLCFPRLLAFIAYTSQVGCSCQSQCVAHTVQRLWFWCNNNNNW